MTSRLSTVVYFAGVPEGGVPEVVAVLRRHGAVTLGVEGNARVTELAAVGGFDYAVTHGSDHEAARADPAAVRELVIALSTMYWQSGPDGLGYLVAFGARVLGLMPAAEREALTRAAGARATGGWLELGTPATALLDEGRAQRAAHEAILAAAGILAEVPDGAYDQRSKPGRNWRPLPETWPQAQPTPRSAGAELRTLQESGPDEPASEITIDHLVAPFLLLEGVHVEGLELEQAVLPFASFADAEIIDAGFVKADLRGIQAPNTRWYDVSLVAADLRWADLRGAELPDTRLDEADCSDANFSGVTKLESAEGARFDRADLRGAHFEGANLMGASFRDADLRDATFMNCALDGIDLTGARLDGTTFEPPRTS